MFLAKKLKTSGIEQSLKSRMDPGGKTQIRRGREGLGPERRLKENEERTLKIKKERNFGKMRVVNVPSTTRDPAGAHAFQTLPGQ